MCRVLLVSRSGFYAWRGRPISEREKYHQRLIAAIKNIHKERHKQNYGSPRVHKQLTEYGYNCSLNQVQKLMKKNGISAKVKRKFKVTTDSSHGKPVAKNILSRNFEATAPNQKWVGDITYIPTGEGFLYLAVIKDLYSKMIIGWSMEPRMKADLVCQALRMAVATRLPLGSKTLMHTDRGSQYASLKHRQVLEAFGITCSMSRKGNCWDNSPCESIFATLKKELVYQKRFKTREEARLEIFDYLEVFYNRERFHSSLDMKSPFRFEEEYNLIKEAA